MAGRLYRMAKVVSANPSSWGIVDAKEISGFRRVAKLTDLYSIAECILSSSYGDGVTDGADAIGQIWYVAETNADYKLINWGNRKSASGWSKLTYGGDVSVPVKDVQVNGATVVSGGIAKIDLTNYAKTEATDNLREQIQQLIGSQGSKSGIATLDENGYVPLEQLGNLDMTVFTVVDKLPTEKIENKVYLVKSSTATEQNNYAEYIYTGDRTATYDASKWEKLGEVAAKVDLSNYYNKSEIDSKVSTINNTASTNTNAIIKTLGAVSSATDIKIAMGRVSATDTYDNLVASIKPATNSVCGAMTPAQKQKLDGIENNANNYTHPIRDDKNNLDIEGLYKIKVDANGHVQKNTLVAKGDLDQLINFPTVDIKTPVSETAYSIIGSNQDNELFNLASSVQIITNQSNSILVVGNGNGEIEGVATKALHATASDSATIAKNDSDGNQISTTYVKKSDNKYYTTDNLIALTEEEINKILA